MKTREVYLNRAQKTRRGLQRVAALTRRARALVNASNGPLGTTEEKVLRLVDTDELYLALADLGGPYLARAEAVGADPEGPVLPDNM